jgi:acetylornithine deacetylase/succinyl-diaminopimelate desuccinylase-like protein
LDEVLDYIEKNQGNYIEELKELLRIPSISTSVSNKDDVEKAAGFVAGKLKSAGISRVEIFKTEGHPIVYGEWLGAPGKPTVLIYGHYDVQPADPLELWNSPPFEPVVKDGKIWARGATDDKGQMFMHIKSVEAFFKTTGSLPLNVKFIIEGEEEIGSENLSRFIKHNTDLLKCDAVLISDTALYGKGIPTLTYGLRGLCYMEVEVTGPDHDLHSGSFGGAVGNPVNILAQMIARLQDKSGKIKIPHFYDDVAKITKKEKSNFKALKFSDKSFAKEVGVKKLQGEKNFSTLERLWVRPTLDCNGIIGGYTAPGAKTVLPSKATAKISMRLVPHQDPKKIARLFTKFVNQIAPPSVKIKIRNLHGAYPVVTSLDETATIAAAKAMQKAFGKKTVFMREGGSIPIVTDFSKTLKAPVVLMGMGLNSENLHSPNEHFDLNHFRLGVISSANFMSEFGS